MPFLKDYENAKQWFLEKTLITNKNIHDLLNAVLNNKFIVIGNDKEITVDKLILATGSYAAPKTGSDGMGINFLKQFER